MTIGRCTLTGPSCCRISTVRTVEFEKPNIESFAWSEH